jgi:predicted transcriptional regulator
MLEGKAKTEYQREYMRRRRAGLPTAKPKPEVRPEHKGSNAEASDIISLRAELDAAHRRIKELEATRKTDLLHNRAFQARLKQYIEDLAEQGRKNAGTMSTVKVAELTMWLERLLVDVGS